MKRQQLPLRGLRPLDAGGIYLLSQITIVMVQVVLTFILGFFVSEGGLDINSNKAVAYTISFLTCLVLFVTPIIYSHFTGINFKREINPKRGISVWQGLLLVVIAFASILAFMPISGLFVELMKLIGYNHEINLPSYYDNFGILVLSLIFVAVLPAISEEVMYRGFVSRGLRKFGIIGAMLLSSLIFATAHGNLMQLVYQFLLGLVLFTVYFATRSIYASMIVHFTNNAFALVFNYIMLKTTGNMELDTGLRGASLVFASLGMSLLGMVILTLLIWAFLRMCKTRQKAYIGDREVPENMLVYGKHNKKGTNFITRYMDNLKWLNFSFEEDELERTYKIPEEIALENSNENDKKYYDEMLRSRLEKDRRWDRNMLFMALGYNIFVLIINIINTVKG